MLEAVLRLPRPLRAAVLLVSCAAQEKPSHSRVALSVLTGDDPCLGADLECSAGLLQRSSGGFRAAQRPKSPQSAEAVPALQTPPRDRAEPAPAPPAPVLAQAPAPNVSAWSAAAAPAADALAADPVAAPAPASTLQREQGQKKTAQDKRAAPTSLLADIRHLVTQVKVSGRTAPEVRHLAEEYGELLEAQAVPSLTAGYKEHQSLLATHARSFARCDSDLDARLETERQLRGVYEGWHAMHKDCRSHEARLQKELAACSHRLNLTSARKQAACATPNVSGAVAGKRNDTSLVQLKRQCQEATQGYVDQWSICAEGERFYDTKRSECDSVQQSMETANCTRASQVSGVCDMYDLCRAGMSLAYASAKEAARAWERYHQAEWLAVVMVRCFAENLGSEAENSTALLGELEKCEQLVTNATLFDLEYPDVPSPRTCTPVSDSPCVARTPSSPSRRTPPAAAQLASAVVADDEKESLPMAVSFVQEGIERASVALPREVHEALFRPFAAPVAMALACLTGLVLIGRCMMHHRDKGQEHSDGRDGHGDRKVDKWCIPSSDASAAGPPISTQLMLDGGRWLCPELLVPKNSKCTIAVPVVSGMRVDSAPANFMVIDKMGQPLFKATAARVPKDPDAGATDGGLMEQLSITRQDGTTLATCQFAVPQAGAARQPDFRLFQRDGLLFATMKRDSRQVSWLSRLLKRGSSDAASGFVFASASAGAWQLRVQGSVNDSRFSFVDATGRVMAAVERGHGLGFGQGTQEFHRLEVGSEADVDLGLVTIVLLTVDRVRAPTG